MGSFSQTTTPQIPPLPLLTRTFASPACVSQIPVGLPPVCAFAGAAPSNAVKIAMMKPNLQAIESPKKAGLHNSKSNLCNAMPAALADHLPQRVRRREAAVLRPNTIMAAPTNANSVQAGASIDTSQ